MFYELVFVYRNKNNLSVFRSISVLIFRKNLMLFIMKYSVLGKTKKLKNEW